MLSAAGEAEGGADGAAASVGLAEALGDGLAAADSLAACDWVSAAWIAASSEPPAEAVIAILPSTRCEAAQAARRFSWAWV